MGHYWGLRCFSLVGLACSKDTYLYLNLWQSTAKSSKAMISLYFHFSPKWHKNCTQRTASVCWSSPCFSPLGDANASWKLTPTDLLGRKTECSQFTVDSKRLRNHTTIWKVYFYHTQTVQHSAYLYYEILKVIGSFNLQTTLTEKSITF